MCRRPTGAPGLGSPCCPGWRGSTIDRGCARLEWAALDWNTPALRFYEKLGARRLHDWEMHRLDGAGLARVASGADGAPDGEIA